jgi:homogentisate 1,2-dioxygenase
MSEFSGPIVYEQDPEHKWNKTHSFKPYGANLTGTMTVHGPSPEAHAAARSSDLKPQKLGMEGLTIFLLETECPMAVQPWALQLLKNPVGTSRL